MQEQNATPKFGFTNFAETWNGRLAMLGFLIGIATELLTGKGILAQLGLM
ncbi:MAG: chlorophyll a/b-binding protein [Gloeomargarita sp. HHBFW_bins_162]